MIDFLKLTKKHNNHSNFSANFRSFFFSKIFFFLF